MEKYITNLEQLNKPWPNIYFGFIKVDRSGSARALVWCLAYYHPHLWDRSPCSESWHERLFGLIRSNGSLKPFAKVIKDFIATKKIVKPTQ